MNVAKLLANAKKNKDALKSRESTIKPKPGKNNYVLLGDWNQERNEEFYKPFSQHFIKDYLCTRQISQNPYPIRVLPS